MHLPFLAYFPFEDQGAVLNAGSLGIFFGDWVLPNPGARSPLFKRFRLSRR